MTCRGLFSFLDDAREIQTERGCTFGEALEIQRERAEQALREAETEVKTNVIQFRPRGVADGMA